MLKRYLPYWLLLLALLLAAPLYIYWGRSLVVALHEATAPEWMQQLLHWAYPRFEVERHRFEAAFFVEKADQILVRTLLVILGGLLLAQALRKWQVWYRETDITALSWAHRLLIALTLFLTWDWGLDLIALQAAKPFYSPISFYALLNLPFPSNDLILVLWGLYWLAGIWLLTLWRPFVASLAFTSLFMVLQGYQYCFEKIDHGYATLGYVLLAWPGVMWAWRRAHRKRHAYIRTWALSLAQLLVGLSYFMSGAEKLLVSGIHWLSADTFRAYLSLHQAPWGMWVLEQPYLPSLLPWGALCFQLAFISILFVPKLRWLLLPAGIAFHFGTYWLLHVGGYLSAWIATYAIFLVSHATQDKRT